MGDELLKSYPKPASRELILLPEGHLPSELSLVVLL